LVGIIFFIYGKNKLFFWPQDVTLDKYGNIIGEIDELLGEKTSRYYSLEIIKGLKIISINTQWMDILNFYLYKNETEDVGRQFDWLKEELLIAERNNEKVYILGHHPPGINEDVKMLPNWIPNKLKIFHEIFKRFNNTIIAGFYGHKHIDSFRLFLNENRIPFGINLMGSAITSWQNRNPGARLFKFDRNNFKLLDYTEFYTNLTEANLNRRMEWKKSYTFSEEYGSNDLSPMGFFNLWKKLKNDRREFDKHNLFF